MSATDSVVPPSGPAPPPRSRASLGRVLAFNVALFLVLVLLVEGAARLFIYWTRGTSTAGLRERTVHLNYQPFVMFGPDMDELLAPRNYPAAAGTVRVMIVGGSTAQGFEPVVLEQALARRFPGRAFQVVNAAYGGYEARQQVIVASLWGPALSPRVIVSIDGANDLESRLRVPRPGTFYLDPAYRLYLTRPFAAPFAYLLSRSQAYNGLRRLAARYQVGPAEEYLDAVPVYAAAQHSLNVLARGMGASRVMVLQPFVAYKQPQSDQERAFTAYRYREEVVKRLFDRAHEELTTVAAADGVAYLDGRFLYQGLAETIFSDDVHFATEKGYHVLADAIAAKLTDGDVAAR